MTYATLEQRRAAREAVMSPGKFEGEAPIVPILWDMVLNGAHDDEDGRYVRIGRWILWIDEQGFVYAFRFDSVQGAIRWFLAMVAEDDSTY